MTDKRSAQFQPGRGYTQQDWDEVSDNPEWTAEDFRNARPFAEVFPDLAESIRRDGVMVGPRSDNVVAIDRDVADKLQDEGEDLQARVNAILRRAVGL